MFHGLSIAEPNHFKKEQVMHTRLLQLAVIILGLFWGITLSAQDTRALLQNNTSGCDCDQNDFSSGQSSGPLIGLVDNNPPGPNRLQGDGTYKAPVTNAHEVPVSP